MFTTQNGHLVAVFTAFLVNFVAGSPSYWSLTKNKNTGGAESVGSISALGFQYPCLYHFKKKKQVRVAVDESDGKECSDFELVTNTSQIQIVGTDQCLYYSVADPGSRFFNVQVKPCESEDANQKFRVSSAEGLLREMFLFLKKNKN